MLVHDYYVKSKQQQKKITHFTKDFLIFAMVLKKTLENQCEHQVSFVP